MEQEIPERLKEIRRELDTIDEQLLVLISKRMDFIPEVAKLKLEHNLIRVQTGREIEKINKNREICGKLKINPDLGEELAKLLIKNAHIIEKEIMGR